MFIYQARESSLVPAGFLTAQFLQKQIYVAFVMMGELRWYFSALIADRTGKVEKSLFYLLLSPSSHSLCSKKPIKRNPTLFPKSKQRLHKPQFLQKLGCQKPSWDQARLSSLVNKVGPTSAGWSGPPGIISSVPFIGNCSSVFVATKAVHPGWLA